MSSFNKVNYNLRLAKNIERKMIAEATAIFQRYLDVEKYQYIGFGSTFFSDFKLFYKMLNISQMISIEKEVNHKERFLFNRPLKFIDMKFGDSTDVLPSLENKKLQPSIIWLDYDGSLEETCFSDISTIIESFAIGSILLISVNAKPISIDGEVDDSFGYRLNQLNILVGEDRVPTSLEKDDLSGWRYADVLTEIINSEIQKSIKVRRLLEDNDLINFHPAFNFRYQDGVKMLTFGGVITDKKRNEIGEFELKKMSFYCPNLNTSYKLKPPILTNKEMMFLDSELSSDLTKFLDKDARSKYELLSRYYPVFSEVDM